MTAYRCTSVADLKRRQLMIQGRAEAPATPVATRPVLGANSFQRRVRARILGEQAARSGFPRSVQP